MDLIPIGIVGSRAGQTLDFDPNTPTGVQLLGHERDIAANALLAKQTSAAERV